MKIVDVNRGLLESAAPSLALDLPSGLAITITRRADVDDRIAAAAVSEDGVTASAAPAGGTNGTQLTGALQWVGEVAGAPGPLSVVTFVDVGSSQVYGNIRFFDSKAKRIRTFRVAPLTTGRPDPVSAAASSSPDAASLFPELDPTKHIIVEYREPQKPRKFRVAKVLPPAAPSSVDTTPPGGKPVIGRDPSELPGLNAMDSPRPTDPADLAAAMAASAGPSGEDFVAAAVDVADGPADSGNTTNTAAADPSSTQGSGARRKLLQTAATRQDVLVVFTAAAASRAGGTTAVTSQIRMAVDMTNKAYADSGVPVVLNLLDIRQVNYNEAGRDVISDMKDNNVPNVFAWRDELGADLVSIFNDNTGVCGVAWMPVSPGLAFSAVMRGCFTSYTFAHEIGHNQGCGHNVEDLNSDANAARSLWGPYAWGWRRCDLGSNSFKTILSYQCTNGVRASEVGLFSTPNRARNNVAVGDASRGNCARGITESATTVANHRAAKTVTPPSNRAITSRLGSKCADAPTWTSGTQLHIWDCHGGPNQQFEHLADGSVRFAGRSQCLDVQSSGTADGTKVQIWDCNGSNAQKWFADSLGRLHPYAAPEKCLDIPGGTFTNGNGLHIWGCHSGGNQQWTAPIMNPNPTFNPQNQMITSRLNTMALDVYAYNYNNGAPVVTWPQNGQNNQKWIMDDVGRLRSTHNTNKCLDASSNGNGAAVYIYDCHTGSNQRWFQDPLGRLRPYHAVSKALDITGANTAQNTRVQLWDALDVPQQKWARV